MRIAVMYTRACKTFQVFVGLYKASGALKKAVSPYSGMPKLITAFSLSLMCQRHKRTAQVIEVKHPLDWLLLPVIKHCLRVWTKDLTMLDHLGMPERAAANKGRKLGRHARNSRSQYLLATMRLALHEDGCSATISMF